MINRIFNCDLDTGNISDDNDKYKNNMMPPVFPSPLLVNLTDRRKFPFVLSFIYPYHHFFNVTLICVTLL